MKLLVLNCQGTVRRNGLTMFRLNWPSCITCALELHMVSRMAMKREKLESCKVA